MQPCPLRRLPPRRFPRGPSVLNLRLQASDLRHALPVPLSSRLGTGQAPLPLQRTLQRWRRLQLPTWRLSARAQGLGSCRPRWRCPRMPAARTKRAEQRPRSPEVPSRTQRVITPMMTGPRSSGVEAALSCRTRRASLEVTGPCRATLTASLVMSVLYGSPVAKPGLTQEASRVPDRRSVLMPALEDAPRTSETVAPGRTPGCPQGGGPGSALGVARGGVRCGHPERCDLAANWASASESAYALELARNELARNEEVAGGRGVRHFGATLWARSAPSLNMKAVVAGWASWPHTSREYRNGSWKTTSSSRQTTRSGAAKS